MRTPPNTPVFPYTTLFRSDRPAPRRIAARRPAAGLPHGAATRRGPVLYLGALSAAGSTASNLPGTSDRIAARSGGAAVGAAGWRAPVLLAIAACALFAYRGVLAVGTAAGSGLPEAEAFMFEPSASSPTLVFAATLCMLAR